MLISGHREGQGVIFSVRRKRIEADAVLRFHLVAKTRSGQRGQKQGIEIVHTEPAGRFCSAHEGEHNEEKDQTADKRAFRFDD